MKAIKFRSQIGKVCDRESVRYALGNVLVTPDGDAIATNGHVLAIAECDVNDGHNCEGMLPIPIKPLESAYVPVEIAPTKPADCRCKYSVDGTEARKTEPKGKVTVSAVHEGRYPKASAVLTDIDPSYCHVIALDAKLLLDLALAINASDADNPTRVEIIISTEDSFAPYVVLPTEGGIHSVGVICPLAVENPNESKDEANARIVKRYHELRGELSRVDAWISRMNQPVDKRGPSPILAAEQAEQAEQTEQTDLTDVPVGA